MVHVVLQLWVESSPCRPAALEFELAMWHMQDPIIIASSLVVIKHLMLLCTLDMSQHWLLIAIFAPVCVATIPSIKVRNLGWIT